MICVTLSVQDEDLQLIRQFKEYFVSERRPYGEVKLLSDLRGRVSVSPIRIYRTDTLGTMLRMARVQMGMSIRTAASKAGISHSHLSQIEKERVRSPSLGVVKRLSDVYGLSFEVLLKELAKSA